MIIENAIITVDPDKAEAFEQAVAKGEPIFRAAAGCHGMALHRIAGEPGRDRLLVTWESKARHVPDFWESPGFKNWQELVRHFFLGTPSLEYNEVVQTYF